MLLRLKKFLNLLPLKEEATVSPVNNTIQNFTMLESEDTSSLLSENNPENITTAKDGHGTTYGITNAFSDIQSINDQMRSIKKDAQSIKEKAELTERETRRIENIVFMGFVVLVVMIAGMVFSFGYFLYENTLSKQSVASIELLEERANENNVNYNKCKSSLERNNQVLTCLKNLGYFSKACFNY